MRHYKMQKAPTIPLHTALGRLPKLIDIQLVDKLIGKRVSVQGHYTGTVVRCNNSPYGAFPGSNYPVIIRLDLDFRGHINKEHAFKLSDITHIED